MDEFEEACDLDGDNAVGIDDCSEGLDQADGCLFVVIGSHLRSNQGLMSNVESFRCPIEFADSIEAHQQSSGSSNQTNYYHRCVYITDEFDFERHSALFKRFTLPAVSNSGADADNGPRYCVLGPPALAQLLLPHRTVHLTSIDWPKRPVYTFGMRGVVACLTGFSEKARVWRIAFLVHCLGGCIRAEVSRKVTHLIAVSTADAKYRKAVTYGIPVMTADWVEAAWLARDSTNYAAGVAFATSGELFTRHRLRPFVGNTLAFYGYSEADTNEMAQLTREAGGRVVNLAELTSSSSTSAASATTSAVTQIVVNDLLDVRSVPTVPACGAAASAIAVRSEWFWLAIQNGYQFAASLYALKQTGANKAESLQGSVCSASSLTSAASATVNGSSTNSSTNAAARKRRRLAPQQPLESLVVGTPDAADMLLSSPAASALHRLSGASSTVSVLDATADSCSLLSPVAERNNYRLLTNNKSSPSADVSAADVAASGNASALLQQQQQQQQQQNRQSAVVDPKQLRRRQKAMELAQTEANYVSILGVIVNVIRREVADTNRPGGALLPDMAIEIIFHGLEPIYKLHREIEAALKRLTENWSDASQVGKVFTDRADQFSQVYPPFVNFVEQAKEEMAKWEQRDPRFRAYLRLCLNRKECLRQSLKELLIRPVQRLPSVTLLLGDLLKSTSEDSPDYAGLQEALAVVRKALDHINKEKQTTDSQLAMFDIMKDIEGCPPSLLSSHRAIVDRVDAIELANGSPGYRPLNGPGSFLSLLLFNDYLQISKQRKNGSSSASASSNAAAASAAVGQAKQQSGSSTKRQYRHLELLHLSRVRRVCSLTDDRDPNDVRRLFALVCRSAESVELFVLSFALIGSTDKLAFLRTLCAQICAATCSAESVDSYFVRLDVDELRVETNGIFDRQHQLSAKARRFGKRVTRALSNRTPRRTLTRAVSAALQHQQHQQQQQQGHDSSLLGDSPCPASPGNESDRLQTSFVSAGNAPGAIVKLPEQQQQQLSLATPQRQLLRGLPPAPATASAAVNAEFKRPVGGRLGESLRRGIKGIRQSFRLNRPSTASAASSPRRAAVFAAAAAAAAASTSTAAANSSVSASDLKRGGGSLADWTLRSDLCGSNTSLASLDSCQSLPVVCSSSIAAAAASSSSAAASSVASAATLRLAAQVSRDDLPKSTSSSRLSIAGLSAKRLRKQLSSWSLSRGK